MESIVGKILCDRYRIIKQLSRGGFSSQFIAEDLNLAGKLQCQIERLQPHYDSEVLGVQSWQRVLKAFNTQGNILKNISQHPQIPQLLDFFECDREFFLVREFIDGETLEQRLNKSLINEDEATVWLQEILGLLDFLNQADLIHLNIQPSSLIQHQNGQKFLTNFASVKNAILFDKKLYETIANDDFSAWELKEGQPDFSSDIYGLGKTIIYALTGQLAEQIRVKSWQLSEEEKLGNSDSIAVADIQPELADILNKMVSKSLERRYQSASEVLEELDFSHRVVTLPPPVFTNFNSPVESKRDRSLNRTNNRSTNSFKLGQKIIWFFLSLPFIVALGIIFIGLNRNIYRNFAAYRNDNYQFEVKYPKAWSYKDVDDPITGEIVVFTSPLETESDPFLEKLHISVEYLSSESITLDRYTEEVIERVEQTKGDEVEVYQDRKTKILETPARMVVYSRQENGLQLRQMETFTIKNDRVYIAIYTAERAKFSKFLDTAKKMINSWEIKQSVNR